MGGGRKCRSFGSHSKHTGFVSEEHGKFSVLLISIFFFPETSFNFFFQLFFTVVNAHNIKLLNDFQRTVQPH